MRVLELFAGAGGAALGLHDAGFEHVACVELNPHAAATLRAAGFPAIEADVRGLDYAALAGEVDLLWASPPCQPWSGLGKRQGTDDDRDGWAWTLAVLPDLRPTWVVCENVPGSRRHIEAAVLPELRKLYAHVALWQLDAADYGTASRRARLFVVAGPRCVYPPVPQPRRTVREVLPHLTGEGIAYYAHECNAGWGMARVPHSIDGQCQAITAGSEQSHGGNGLLFVTSAAAPGLALPPRSGMHRRATVVECALLMGFPATHPFEGNLTQCRRQVGNAVPPSLAEAVARQLLGTPAHDQT